MKFSVLLPTRNGLDYLRYAIETVRFQDYNDWELVISDNDSEQDIQAYIRSLNESRIVYFRTPKFVPVSENWNYALKHSTGEYVVMLGDDDGLMPGYFSTLARIVAEYGGPDVVHTGAFLYAYPGVVQGYPSGFVQNFCNPMFDAERPSWLSRNAAAKLVKLSVQLKMRFPTNIQFSLVSRRLIDELCSRGAFFQSPYPDFYATNAIFLMARSILIYQKPLVVIGVCRKSFGFYHNNRSTENEIAGAKFLQTEAYADQFKYLAKVLLPWCNYNTCWLLAMEAVKNNFKDVVKLNVGYRRYRFLQILNLLKNRHFDRSVTDDQHRKAKSHLTFGERILYLFPFAVVFTAMRVLRYAGIFQRLERFRKYFGQYTIDHPRVASDRFKNILDVFQAGEVRTNKEAAPLA